MAALHFARQIRPGTTLSLVLAFIVGLGMLFPGLVSAQAARPRAGAAKPTIVLVHGAWADASSWAGVVTRLQRQGYTVLAPATPLRGLGSDSAYLGSILDTVPGPVVLVGHSYGGAVITSAATGRPHVKALVYVAAFVPDEGEDVFSQTGRYPGESLIVPPGFPGATLVPRPFPVPGGVDLDLYIAVDKFRAIFAADVPAPGAAVMAASQRPIALSAGTEKSGPAAWKSIPSWALVATADRAIGTSNVRVMAQRAGARIVEVDASHAVPVSQPDDVAALVIKAARAVS